MNKLWIPLAVSTFVLAGFSGCFGGGDNGDGTTNIDENAVYDAVNADNGFRVIGNVTSPGVATMTGADGSAAYAAGVDSATLDDSQGALDKADLTLDVREPDGTRVQAGLRAMTTAESAGLPTADFFGGVNNNFEVHGDSGIGLSEFPKVKAYLFIAGFARVVVDNESLEDLHLVLIWASRGIRDSGSGALATQADTSDLELHILFPGTQIPNNPAITVGNATDPFLYYYFENVKLKQLSTDDKAKVGEKLQAPRKPNLPPVALGALKLADGTVVQKVDLVQPANANITVTLDASNSTDPDGTIEAFSWVIFEVNNTGVLEQVNKTTGVTATTIFAKGGLKQVNLRVIDDQGGIANTTLFLFVDLKLTWTHEFGQSGQEGSSAGAGHAAGCVQAFNCNYHHVTVEYGAQKMTIAAPTQNSGNCNSPVIDVYKPGSTSTFKNDATFPVNIDAADLQLGRWKGDIIWNAQVKCKYSSIVTVQYSPVAAA